MSAAQPDYYEVLGLPPSATSAEIKKRYRELARRYHPDVNSSPEAGQKIKSINEAYHVLGDEDRRSTYDATRLLRSHATTRPAPASATPSAPPRPPNSARPARPQRPPFADGPADFNGFGRTAPEPPPAANGRQRPTPASPTDDAARRSTNPFGTVDRLVAEAQLAFINHRYRESENLCQEALLIDRRNAIAQEILGDICVKRGLHNRAATHYSYAIQFNPRNFSVQAKLDRLLGRQTAPYTGPVMARAQPVSSFQRWADGPNRDMGISLLSAILFLAFLGVLTLLNAHPGIPLVFDFSPHLFVALAFNGVIAGVMLAFYGGMRPISEELLARKITSASQSSTVPLGSVLVLFAVVWFYLSLVVYIGIGIAKDRISPSLLRVYGSVILLSVVFATLYKPDFATNPTAEAAAFSGNILFPAMLLGWAIGDAIRLRSR